MEEELVRETKIEVCISIIFVLVALLLPIGILRRRHRNSVLKVFGWGVYTGITLLITYAYALLGYEKDPQEWVLLLMFVFGSVDQVNALNLNDRGSVIVIWVKNCVHFSLALSLVFRAYKAAWSLKQISVVDRLLTTWLSSSILVFTGYKVVERVGASQYATGDDSTLASLVLNVSKSMGYHPIADIWVHPNPNPNTSSDPYFGCKYVVDPLAAITLNTILFCQDGSILSSSTRDSTCQLNNTCISFSLFWLLLHKFASIPSYESSHKEAAWKFVKHGLLKTQESFRVVEVELAFLYDFFYTKYFYFYVQGFWCQLMKHVLFHGAFTYVTYDAFEDIIVDNLHDSETLVTASVLTIITVMEVVQFVVFLRSRWSKMMLICLYRKRESWKKQTIWDCCIHYAATIVCPLRVEYSKPWHRKLGQYSLLQSFSSRRGLLCKIASVMLRALTGIRFLRPGRKENDGIALTNEIEQALIQSLEEHGPKFTKGLASLEANAPAITRKLQTAFSLFKTDAQVILAWHIATSLCEINPQLPPAIRERPHFHVATSLSKYCAYLVAFAPNMLPGNVGITDYTCSRAIEDAYTRINDCQPSNMYSKLMEIAESEADQPNRASILRQGAVLGKLLDTEIMDQGHKWKVLADFWAELILYLAPNAYNEWAHAERLADGGEFISHLWVLLFHAGIVDRDFQGWPGESASSETYTPSVCSV